MNVIEAVFTLLAISIFVAAAAIALSVEDALVSLPARRRARRLFLSRLNERQRREWKRHRYFDIVGSTGRRYRMFRYRAFNVCAGGYLYCVQVDGEIPVFDKLLAQRLLLETDEPRFLSLANMRRA